MLKITCMSDNPSLPTGMAKVGREVAMALYRAGHDVSYIGWFENPPSPKNFPFKVIPCQNRYFGSDIIDTAYRQEQWDILITIGDMWRLDYLADPKRCTSRKLFQWVAYCAIDGEAINGGVPKYLQPIYTYPDKVIAYTEYGKEAILKSLPHLDEDLGMIYHGVDPNVFYPVTQKEREELRAKYQCGDKFVFLVVARNQGRKNIPEIFKAWLKVTADDSMPNANLFPHMNFDNESMGLPISQILETYGFGELNRKNIIFMQGVAHGTSGITLPDESVVNELMNAADCLVMAGSEGFGLPCLEAMACKLPVIALDHSATGELCADGRGWLVPVAYNITGTYMHERPYPNIDALYQAMHDVYHSHEERKARADKAYKFAMNHSWANKGDQFCKVIEALEYPLTGAVKLKEVA